MLIFIRQQNRTRYYVKITPPALWSAEHSGIENDVSILQDVTLGGTGKEVGDRRENAIKA